MNLLEQIELIRKQEFIGDEESFKKLVAIGEVTIVKYCKNLDPARPYVTSQELEAYSKEFGEAYSVYGSPQERKLLIKHLEDSGLEVFAYRDSNRNIHFRLTIPPVPEIYKDGLAGLEELKPDEKSQLPGYR